MHTSTVSPRTPYIPNARTTLGRKRQRIHALVRDLGLSESAYRNILMSLTGSRYARYLDEPECDTVIAFMRGALSERTRIVAKVVEPVSDDEALAVLG
jgi:hypothetical protein